MLKKWLDEKSIEFIAYDVDENPIAAQNMVRISGQRSVPFSTVENDDGKVVNISGFDRFRFNEALNIKNF
jgi:glutaredoxin